MDGSGNPPTTRTSGQKRGRVGKPAHGAGGEDFNRFKRYDYISRTSPGGMTGEVFIREALALVAASPKADGAR